MFSKIRIICLASSIVLTTGCATKPFEAVEGQSYAKNVSMATGLTRQSGPIKDTEIDLEHSSYDSLDALTEGSAGIAGLTGYLRDAGPVTGGFMGHLFLGSFILNMFGPKHPVNYSQTFVWMPQEGIPEEAAAQKYASIYLDAYRSILPEGYELVHKIKKFNTIFGSNNDVPFYALEGESCKVIPDSVLDDLDLRYSEFIKLEGYCVVGTSKLQAPENAVAPEWLGGYEAYSWGMIDDDINENWAFYLSTPNYYIDDPRFKDQVENLAAISKALPKWIYFYIPPNEEEKKPGFILNEGKQHYFIIEKKDKS